MEIDVFAIIFIALCVGLIVQGGWEFSRCQHYFVGLLMGIIGTAGITLLLYAVSQT